MICLYIYVVVAIEDWRAMKEMSDDDVSACAASVCVIESLISINCYTVIIVVN